MQNIINELYKTNLKFRTTDSSIIEILNDQFIPIAAIFPVIDSEPEMSNYLKEKGEAE